MQLFFPDQKKKKKLASSLASHVGGAGEREEISVGVGEGIEVRKEGSGDPRCRPSLSSPVIQCW